MRQPTARWPAHYLSALYASALNGLFPNYCTLCGLQSHSRVPLCAACQSNLLANVDCCERCALPLPPVITARGPAICNQCLQTPPAFDRVIAPWLYDEQIAALIRRWKFDGERRFTPLLAHLWLSQFDRDISHIDRIVPVPLHWSKLLRREFNQSELLTLEIRKQYPKLKAVKLDARLVKRHQATSAQSGLDAWQRKFNLLAAFTARSRCDNLRIAIVDDVLTTGATATAMATTLRDAGASHIEIWCIARTPEPGN